MAVYDAQGNRLSIRALYTYSLDPDHYRWYSRVLVNPGMLSPDAEYTICFLWLPKGEKHWQHPMGDLYTLRLVMGSTGGHFIGPVPLEK
jgi:hypothetical protein